MFYLMFGLTDWSIADHDSNKRTRLPDPRYFLDSYPHARAQVVHTIEADTWLDARAQIDTSPLESISGASLDALTLAA
jgi:hypothetical protein